MDIRKRLINIWNLLFVAACAVAMIAFASERDRSDDPESQIFSARFTETEFLGARTIVPRPARETADALRAFLEKYPENERAIKFLAAACESARDFECAETAFKRLSSSDSYALADFYGRRARYTEQIDLLVDRLENTEIKGSAVKEILEIASRHGFRRFLSADWVISATPPDLDTESIIEHGRIIETNGDRSEAIRLLERHAARGDRTPLLIRERVAMLERNGEPDLAADVYAAEFDPLWQDDENQEFYRFLAARKRLEKYETGLRRTFLKSPSDIFVALRLADISAQNGDDSEDFIRIAEIEKARRAILWRSDELIAAARFRRREQNLNEAVRYLHAVAVTDADEKIRRSAATEIFKILLEAGNHKISLARGDFEFFRETASADLRPGAATGILSLLTSDMDIADKFDESETNARELFNMDAAAEMLRVASSGAENPLEIASMHRDLAAEFVKLGHRKRADALLERFESKLDTFEDWPGAAANLADGYKLVGDASREQEILRQILARTAPGAPRGGDASYENVLARLADLYHKTSGAQSVLELYGREIERFADNEELRLNALSWLEKSGTVAEQEKAFRRAAAELSGREWKNRLARWFVRQRRDDDFAELADRIVALFPENETGRFLTDVVEENGARPETRQGKLFVRLYGNALARFPDRVEFARRLLSHFSQHNQDAEWNALALRYFCLDEEIRREFIARSDRRGSVPSMLDASRGRREFPYALFRAEANARLSKFEDAFADFRELRAEFPENQSIETAFLTVARSLGQTNREFLLAAAADARNALANDPANANKARLAGEISAEAGEFVKAREMWRAIIATGAGDPKNYLDAASTNWDYFMFEEALRNTHDLRAATRDDGRLAYEAGAIYESRGDLASALGEYFRAVAVSDSRAERRLTRLAGRDSVRHPLSKAFRAALDSGDDDFAITEFYCRALYASDRRDESMRLVNDLVKSERDLGRLRKVMTFLSENKEFKELEIVLGRMASVAPTTGTAARYRLELAGHLRHKGDDSRAANEIRRLVAKFPENFRVIKESSAFMLSLGRHNEAIDLLERAIPRLAPAKRHVVRRRIAELKLNHERASDAVRIAQDLLEDRPDDLESFSILAEAALKTGATGQLKTALRTVSASLLKADLSVSERSRILGPYRRTAIRIFVRARDFSAAGDQYIELINMAPEDDELIDEALGFAVRTRGADRLIEYYRQTAATSFRNPRWNVILARLYRAGGDHSSAVENYRAVIALSPAAPDIYEQLVEVLIEDGQFASALIELENLIEIDGESVVRIRRKSSLLAKLGRIEESNILAASLPQENAVKNQPNESLFERAARIGSTDPATAVTEYRDAAESAVSRDEPVRLTARDIHGFVSSLRAAREPAAIREVFGFVRKLRLRSQTAESRPLDRENSAVAQKSFISEIASLNETTMTLCDFDEIEELLKQPPADDERRFLIDFARAARLMSAEENLVRGYYEGSNDRAALDELLAVLRRRGKFAEALSIALPNLPDLSFESAERTAIDARMIDDSKREIEALRAVVADKRASRESLTRYVQLCLESNREELSNVISSNSPHLGVIAEILFNRGESELAEAALNSFSPRGEARQTVARSRVHFERFASSDGALIKDFLGPLGVGKLVTQNSDTGDIWFQTAETYSDWLNRSGNDAEFDRFSIAETERFPRSGRAHFTVGLKYHARRDFIRAYEHFRIATTLEPQSPDFRVFLGAAAFNVEGAEKAREIWREMLGENASAETMTTFVRVHHEFGLAPEARGDIIRHFEVALNRQTDDSALIALFRAVNATFSDASDRNRYFLALPGQTRVAELLLRAEIATGDLAAPFAKTLLRDIASDLQYQPDYRFAAKASDEPDQSAAEASYDAETDYGPNEFESEKLDVIKPVLENLVEKNSPVAAQLADELARSFRGSRPRPEWLRAAEFRLRLRRDSKLTVLDEVDVFTGLKPINGSSGSTAPNADRIRISAEVLENEGFSRDAELLRVRSSGRRIALGLADESDFAALARWLKRSGDEDAAIKILRAMTEDSGKYDLALTSNPEVARLIGEFISPSADGAKFDRVGRLSVAAALASELGFPAAALEFRLTIAEIAPRNSLNLIELGRLEIANHDHGPGIRRLSSVAADASTPILERHLALVELVKVASQTDEIYSLVTISLDESDVAANEKMLFAALLEISRNRNDEGAALIAKLPDSEEIRAIRCAVGEYDTTFSESCFGSFGKYVPGAAAIQIQTLLDAGLWFAAVETAKKLKFGELATSQTSRWYQTVMPLGNSPSDNSDSLARKLLPRLSDAAADIGDLHSAVLFAEAAERAAPEGFAQSSERADRMRELLREAEVREATRFRVLLQP